MTEDKDLQFIIDNKDTNRAKHYPEHKLTGRGRLAYEWLPDNCDNILDGGCSYGYVTKYFRKKANKVYALDLDDKHIEIAKSRYPDIDFRVGSIDETGFESAFFDAIVLTDVLEHTPDRIKTLNELHRILKPGGKLILTTPHKGLFGFMDPYNHGYNLKTNFKWLYKGLYKIVRFIKERKIPKDFNPLHNEKHHHYSVKDYKKMLDTSSFSSNYEIDKVSRPGLFIEVFTMNLEAVLQIVLKKKISDFLLKPLAGLSMIDYRINYGPLGYNIAIRIIKQK